LPGPEFWGYAKNDVARNAIPAWNKHEAAGSAFDACLAVLAAISSQAVFATDENAPLALEETLVDIRGGLPLVEGVRTWSWGFKAEGRCSLAGCLTYRSTSPVEDVEHSNPALKFSAKQRD
jgi:hypothetical protein